MDSEPLPRGWSWATLGSLASASGRAIVSGPFGSNIGSRFFVEAGVPVIRGNNLTADLRRFLDDGFVFLTDEKAEELRNCDAVADDLVFTAAGSLGQVGLIPKAAKYPRYVISNKQMRARLDSRRVNPLFAFYWFSSPRMVQYVQQRNTGSSVPLINLSVLRSLPIPVPPLADQDAIVGALASLDDKIELNHRMSGTLESMVRALFKSWFVDFDPVRAKSRGRDPGLSRAAADLFPDAFEDSELGVKPLGWGVKRVGDLLSLDKGLSYKGEHLGAAGVPMVNLGCFLGDGRFDSAALKAYSGPFQPRHIVREGDLVLANTDITQKRDVIGSAGLVPPSPGDATVIFTHHVFAARFFTEAEDWKSFIRHTLLRGEFRERARGFATGTTVLALPRDSVLDFRFVAPPPPVLKAFTEVAQHIQFRQWELLNESSTLGEIRDALLSKLLTGEVRVAPA